MDKPFVFVLMPFDVSFDDIYKLGIKRACTDIGMYCERVDEQYFEGSMLDRIYNQINHADYIIADTTNKNANVFYEIGYAHGKSKSVVLITQDVNDIPFDMQHFQHIVYDKLHISELQDKVKARLLKAVDDSKMNNMIESNIQFEPLQVFLGKQELNTDVRTQIPFSALKRRPSIGENKITIEFVLYNPNPFVLPHNSFPTFFDVTVPDLLVADISSDESVQLPNETLMITSDVHPIHPGRWSSKNIYLKYSSKRELPNFTGELQISHDGKSMLYEFEFMK